jgi:hypothetical protein
MSAQGGDPTARAGGLGGAFPLWVTAGTLALTLALLVTTTLPALQDRDALQRTEREKTRLRDLYEEQRRANQRSRAALRHDPQTILLEMDRLGLMPDELVPPAGDAAPAETARR